MTEGEVQIGGATEHGDYFNGRIDEVRIYNRSLSEAEVEQTMTATFPTVVTEAATEPEANSAILHGTYDLVGPYAK